MRVVPIVATNVGPLTGSGTNSYLVTGARPTLIDAPEGTAAYIESVADALARTQPGSALAQVLITHAHSDHIGGVDAIAKRWPAASFAKIPDAERDRKYGVAWAALRDDEVVYAGDATLWVVHTPGHAPDHASFYDARSGLMFCGDLVVNGGTVTIPPSSGGHLGQYLSSLRRLLELQPRRMLPGHGPPIENPGALVRAYIGHRLAREQQIVEALERGPATIEEIVARLYADLVPALRGAAAENVLAHLLKLKDEGRASSRPDAWVLTTGSCLRE